MCTIAVNITHNTHYTWGSTTYVQPSHNLRRKTGYRTTYVQPTHNLRRKTRYRRLYVGCT